MSQTKAQLIAGTSSQDVTFNDATVNSLNGGPLAGSRNRIINGDMRIAQRGTSGIYGVGVGYVLDRWGGGATIASNMRVQQVTDAPAGFTNSLKADAVTGATITASDYFTVYQFIEGFNTSDLGFGTASASDVTLSFWVKSSVTGTHSGALRNSANDRSYPYTYTISSADTWEKKEIVIPGDTSGTWSTNNSKGFEVVFDLAAGSTFRGTAGAWAGANYVGATGAVSPLATSGATWYLTGVQLEPGTVATPFERRSYGQELALCSRYCQVLNHAGIFNGSSGTAFVATKWSTTDFIVINVPLVCQMRVAPSITQSSATNRYISNFGGFLNSLSAATCSSKGPIMLAFTNNAIAASFGWVDDIGIITASSEL